MTIDSSMVSMVINGRLEKHMTNTDLPFQAMQDGWRFLAKWINHQGTMTNQDWDAVVSESKNIWEASGRNQLVGDVLTAYMGEIERRNA